MGTVTIPAIPSPSDVADHITTHHAAHIIAGVELGKAVLELAGIVGVVVLLLPEAESAALREKFNRAVYRMQTLIDASSALAQDTLDLLTAQTAEAVERMRSQ